MNDVRKQLCFISDSLWDKRISLECLGISSQAWSLDVAKEILSCAKFAGIGVLGGDLYDKVDDQKIVVTYENWYTNHDSGESNEDFSDRSVRRAYKFVERASTFKLANPVIDIVFDLNC